MSYFSVNGIEMRIPIHPEAPFEELLQYLRKSLVTEKALISSVRVNGDELNGNNEANLAQTPISQLKSVEILTAHPREIVEDTLQNLLEFIEFLKHLSLKAADLASQPDFYPEYTRLVDGIATLTDAVTHVKGILKIGVLQPVQILEADLLSILKDLLSSQKSHQWVYVADLLRNHLFGNLQQWKDVGIPALIRSRDC